MTKRFKHPLPDQTYIRDEIKKDPILETAFILSECLNDGTPIGWSKYIWVAQALDKAKLIRHRENEGPG